MPNNDIELQVAVTSQGVIAYDTHYVERIINKAAESPVTEDTAIPEKFILSQNFPNPFNPETAIRFGLPKNEHVQLVVIDLMGREIRKLVEENMEAGYHSVVWDGKDHLGQVLPSGIYVYRISAGAFQDRKKLTLVR